MSIRKTLLAATILALPLAAQAQPVNGLYVAAGAGVNWQSRMSGTGYYQDAFGSGSVQRSVSTDPGWVILGSVGWGFGNGLRAEIEMNYRSNDVSELTFNGFSATSSPGSTISGTTSTYGVMANVFYDFQLGPVMPYLGAGIGYAWNRWSSVGYSGPFSTGGISDTQGSFAYQFMAGLAIPIRAVPGLAITAEYRYFATNSVTMRGTYMDIDFGPGTEGMKSNNENQSVLLGVRYNFGRAPAAPPPVAAPAPATSFIVFFDFNRSDLTARAREIVAQAAAAARTAQVTRIEVAGHTDTVGSAQYNLGLSQRRANTVAAELVRLGVPRQAISTAGYGFSRPLVPTGPNVREPQNRRVEIVFR